MNKNAVGWTIALFLGAIAIIKPGSDGLKDVCNGLADLNPDLTQISEEVKNKCKDVDVPLG